MKLEECITIAENELLMAELALINHKSDAGKHLVDYKVTVLENLKSTKAFLDIFGA